MLKFSREGLGKLSAALILFIMFFTATAFAQTGWEEWSEQQPAAQPPAPAPAVAPQPTPPAPTAPHPAQPAPPQQALPAAHAAPLPPPAAAEASQPLDPSATIQPTQTPVGEKPKVAVYITGGIPDNLKSVLGAKILSAFMNSGDYDRGLESSNTFLVQIDSAQKAGAIDDAMLIEIGTRVGIDLVCAANISQVFDEYSVSSRVVNVKTASATFLGEFSSPLQSITDLDAISDKIAASYGITLRPPAPAPVAAPPAPAPAVAPPVQTATLPPPQLPEETPPPAIDMTGSIAQIAADLVNQSVGKKFGQAVGDAVSEIVVAQVRNELARRGNISADDNIGQIVGKIVEQTVSQEVAKKVPGPAGKMGGGQVGKAVGKSIESAVNEMLGGGGAGSQAYGSAGAGESNEGGAAYFIAPEWMATEKMEKSKTYIAPKWMPPITSDYSCWWAFNFEIGRTWGYGWFWALDFGLGLQKRYGELEDMSIGLNFTLGHTIDLPAELQLAYGISIGPSFTTEGKQEYNEWQNCYYDYYGDYYYCYNYYGYDDLYRTTKIGIGGPIVKLRWHFIEVTYRGLMGIEQNKDESGWGDIEFGYINQLMFGFYLKF